LTAGPSDYTIIGTVLAVSIAIILLAGLALYVAFRVRETLHEERGSGAKAAKVAFLIGLLFLSGGVFYFFASGFNSGGNTSSTLTTGPPSTSTSGTTAVTSPSSGSPTTSTSTSTASSMTTTASSTGSVGMTVNCPSSAAIGSSFSCTVSIDNAGGSSYQSTVLTSQGDLAQFTLTGCSETVNGNPASCTVVSATQVSVGSLSPGLTYLTVSLSPPSSAGQKSCSLVLSAVGLQSVTSTFTMQVNH
jgi:hypothetical protein